MADAKQDAKHDAKHDDKHDAKNVNPANKELDLVEKLMVRIIL